MSRNKLLNTKTGVYIGEGLIDNPNHPVKKLNFKGCDLKEDGLIRIVEACNKNKNIISVNLGLVSNRGLKNIAEILKNNKSLSKLKFAENPDLKWSIESK
jgi:hypothetical protein